MDFEAKARELRGWKPSLLEKENFSMELIEWLRSKEQLDIV